MTKPKAAALGARGPGALAFWDGDLVPSLPDLRAALAGTGLDADAFAQWLHEPLVSYRHGAFAMAGMPQKAAVLAWIAAAERNLEQALQSGELKSPPAFMAGPLLDEAALRRANCLWRRLLVSGNQQRIRECLREARERLGTLPTKRGRRSTGYRDHLHAKVVAELVKRGVATMRADDVADEVLRACSAPAANTAGRTARRRARKLLP